MRNFDSVNQPLGLRTFFRMTGALTAKVENNFSVMQRDIRPFSWENHGGLCFSVHRL